MNATKYIDLLNEYLRITECRTLNEREIANVQIEWKRATNTSRIRMIETMEDGIKKFSTLS